MGTLARFAQAPRIPAVVICIWIVGTILDVWLGPTNTQKHDVG